MNTHTSMLTAAVFSVVLWGCGGGPAPCGAGTVAVGDRCEVVQNQAGQGTCGTDTALQGTTCISVLSCGQGASRSGNQCVATPVDVTCGVGTELQGKVCVATGTSGGLTCGMNTTQVGSQCVGATAGTTCGTGTALMGSSCVVDLGTVCGTDTAGAGGNRCVSTLSCGTGTTKSGSQCVANGGGGTTCGPGTVLQGTQCLPAQPTGPLSTFLAATNLSAGGSMPTGPSQRRIVVTELTQGNAEAWAATGANMVGTGRALHLTGYGYWVANTTPDFLTIEDTAPGGSCSSTASPNAYSTSDYDAVRIGFYNWSGGSATRTACARSGTVKIERSLNSGGTYQTKLTLNAYFSDGTTLTDKIIWL